MANSKRSGSPSQPDDQKNNNRRRDRPASTRGLDKLQEAQVSRTRSTILTAAAKILAVGGVDALTVDAVINESGVARSTIYRQFGTVHHLVVAAFRELLGPPPNVFADGDLRTQLISALSILGSELSAEPGRSGLPSLLGAAAHDPIMAGLVDEFFAEQRAPLDAIIRDAVKSGELPVDTNAEFVAGLLIGPVIYWALIRRETLGEAAIASVVESALRNAD